MVQRAEGGGVMRRASVERKLTVRLMKDIALNDMNMFFVSHVQRLLKIKVRR